MAEYNIYNLFADAAGRNPDTIALIQDDKTISYSTLQKRVHQTAAHYQKKGIRRGDKVLVFMPISPELYRVVLALFAIGAAPVFLDEWVSLERLRKCCELVPCRGLIAGRNLIFLSMFIRQLRRIPIKIAATVHGSQTTIAAVTATDEDDTALITFTTGTTGIPKAANRTHGFLQAQFRALQPLVNNGCQNSLVTLPIVVLINLGLGKTTILPSKQFKGKRPETADKLTEDIGNHRVEEIICSPAILQRVAASLVVPPQHVSHIITGGGSVFPDLARQVLQAFPAAKATVVYGSTESEPISHINMEELAGVEWQEILSAGLCVGTPDKAAIVVVIHYTDDPIPPQTKEGFRKLQLIPGQTGELIVAGEHVLKSYVNNPQAVQRQKINIAGEIWHRTGDAGKFDETGRLYFFGPCKEVLQHDGRTLYPVILCYTFKQITGTKQCGLLRINGKLTLVIESNDPIPEDLLLLALQQTGLSKPDIVYVKKIPVDPRHHTKVDYDQLRLRLSQ